MIKTKSDHLEEINCVQTIVLLVCEQISSYSFKNYTTNKLLTKKSYIYI